MIESIEARNFLSIEEIVCTDLHEIDTMGIVGSYEGKDGYSNGSGKSSLAEVILFCLTGKHRYKTDPELIRIGSKELQAKLEIISGKDKIIIERILRRKSGGGSSSAIKVEINKVLKATSTREGQVVINEFFRTNPDDFINSSFFRQKEYDELLRARSNDRIKFMERFFEAYIFDIARKKVSELRKGNNRELNNKREVLLEKTEEIGDISEQEYKDDLKSQISLRELLLKERVILNDSIGKLFKDVAIEEAKLDGLEKSKEEISSLKDDLEEYKRKGKKLKKDRASFENELEDAEKSIENLGESLPELIEWTDVEEEKLQNTKDRREKCLVSLESKKIEIKGENDKLDDIYSVNCPVCKRPIDSDLQAKLKKDVEDRIDKLTEEVSSLDKDYIVYEEDIASLKSHNKEVYDVNFKRDSISRKIEALEVKKVAANNMMEVLDETLKDLRKAYDKAKKKVGELGDISYDDTKLKKLEGEVKSLQESSKEGERDIGVFNTEIAELEVALKDIVEKKKYIKNAEQAIKKLQSSISDLSRLDDLYEKCRMEVISTGLNEVEETATEIIETIGATQKQIIFETVKETQGGMVKNSLDIYLEDQKGKRAIEGLSGGEWDLTAFSVRAALAKYKLARMDSKIDFLVLDEIFGSLDENSREELISAINIFDKDFSQVFIISHTNLKDVFDYTLKVEMGEDNITRLKE